MFFEALNGGGSESSVKTGTLTTPSTASTKFTVDTGVTDMNHFFLWAKNQDTAQREMITIYDKDIGNFYTNFRMVNGTANGTRLAFQSTPRSAQFNIESIINGVVTLYSESGSSFLSMDAVWYAD